MAVDPGATDRGPEDPADTDPDDAGLDELRRRLYRSGATDADVRRYVAERGARTAEPRPIPLHAVGVSVPAVPRRRSRRRATVLLALAAAAAVVLIVQVARPAVEAPRISVVPAPSQALLQDIGDGQVLAVDRGEVSRPVAVPVSLHGRAVAAQRFTGRGNAIVAVRPPRGEAGGGRASVVLTARGSSAARWRALLTVTRNETTSYPVVMAAGMADPRSSSAGTTVFVYPMQPPTLVAVAAAPGVRWTLEVAVANGL